MNHATEITPNRRAAALCLVEAIATHYPGINYDSEALLVEMFQMPSALSLQSQPPELLVECWYCLVTGRLESVGDEDIEAHIEDLQQKFAAGHVAGKHPTWAIKAAADVLSR